jgi:hypothetical protein
MDKRTLLGVMAFAGMLGCSGSDSGSAGAGLTIDEETGAARGTFVDVSEADLGQVDFVSRFVDTNVLEIVVDFHGLTISSVVDYDSGVIEYDGFTTETGEDTQILDEDRALLLAFTRALDTLGVEVSEPIGKLRTFVGRWAEYPTSLELQGVALMPEDRGWESICWAMYSWVSTSHDCTEGCKWYRPWCSNSINSWWTDNTTLDYSLISFDGAGPCGDGTYFWNGSWWQCYEPSHVTDVEWGYGNCFGRCGDGCGSNRQFTRDCAYHDECVRVGHSDGSASCNDQFESTADDWAYAPDC